MNTTRLTATATKSPLARAIEAARRAPWLAEGINFFRRQQIENQPMTRAQLVREITKNRCHCGGSCSSCQHIIKDMIGDYPH